MKIKQLLTSGHSSLIKKGLNKKHCGFVITLEVMLSMVIFTMFSNYTLYLMRVMNGQRYINTILTSTASQASRWGGNQTNAFKNNSGSGSSSIQQLAQTQLNNQVKGFNAVVTVTPTKITKENRNISVTITYQWPKAFEERSSIDSGNGMVDVSQNSVNQGRRTVSIQMPSVMQPGDLL